MSFLIITYTNYTQTLKKDCSNIGIYTHAHGIRRKRNAIGEGERVCCFFLFLSLSIQALTVRFLLSLSEAFMVVRTNLKENPDGM